MVAMVATQPRMVAMMNTLTMIKKRGIRLDASLVYLSYLISFVDLRGVDGREGCGGLLFVTPLFDHDILKLLRVHVRPCIRVFRLVDDGVACLGQTHQCIVALVV